MLKNKRILCILFFAFTVFFICVSTWIMSLFDINKWVGVSVSFGILSITAILCIAFAAHAKQIKETSLPIQLNISVFIANSFAIGLAVSSVYTYFGHFPNIWQIALVGTGTIVLYCLFCLFTLIPLIKRHYIIGAICYIIIVLTLEILATVYFDRYIFSFALFLMLPFIGFIITLSIKTPDSKALMKNITIFSFSALILAILIAIFIISEGDGADVVADIDITSKNKKNKNDNPYIFHR